MAKSKLFPSEKVLTVSALDYCASKGRNLIDYDLIGVTFEAKDNGNKGRFDSEGQIPDSDWIIANFRQKIPKGVEAIVDFRFAYGGVAYAFGYSDTHETGVGKFRDLRSMASGTALVRKKKVKK